MKHHLNVVIIALRVILFAAGIMCIFNLVMAYGFIVNNDTDTIYGYFREYFSPLNQTVVGNIDKLGAAYFAPIQYLAIGFTLSYTALLIYGMAAIVRFYKCLLKIEKGQMFYYEQGIGFRRVGGSIIIFAKVKYCLFCLVGILSYLDISQFFRQIPQLLLLYLVGKLILIMSYMAEKGEFIKEENELTI